jgi:hypothetical protein
MLSEISNSLKRLSHGVKQVHYAPDQARRDFKTLVQHYDDRAASTFKDQAQSPAADAGCDRYR